MPRTKPSVGVPISRTHPLAYRMCRAWVFNDRRGRDSAGWVFRDVIEGDVATYARNAGDTLYADGPSGSAFSLGADGGGNSPACTQPLSRFGSGMTAGSFTIIGRYKKTGANPNFESLPGALVGGCSNLFLTRRLGADTAGIILSLGATTALFGADGNGMLLGAKYDTTINNDQWYTVGATFARDASVGTYGGTWTLFLDGLPVAVNNYNLAGSFGGTFTDNIPFIFGDKDPDAGQSTSDKIADYLYIWNRALSPSEVRAVTLDPFCMFGRSDSRELAASGAATNRRRRLLCGGTA